MPMGVRIPPPVQKTKTMSTDSSLFKVIPSNLNKGFGFCVFGEPTQEVLNLAESCNFIVQKEKGYTNFFPTEKTDFGKMFIGEKKFKYMDGFSPNLNKHLHIGHFSNLILAKAFQKLGVAEEYISILGDTLKGEVSKEEALEKFKEHCKKFDYKVDKIFFASEMKYEGELKNGEGEYEGTKIVEAGEEKIVVIKKDGSTSYFYQDLALASLLNDDTLYLTGYEQENHFKLLSKVYPHITHVGLGLVKLKSNKMIPSANGKMSTRLGNVVYLSDFMEELKEEFNGDEKLAYNIFAGYILGGSPKSDKTFDMNLMKNHKNSPGLYLSYTMARLKSAGVDLNHSADDFIKPEIKYAYIKAKAALNPSVLFQALVELCKEINSLYTTHHISGNEDNKAMFSKLMSDLYVGMKKIGLFEVDNV